MVLLTGQGGFLLVLTAKRGERYGEYQSIIVEHDGPVARITLNRPDRLNSFTAAMHEELKSALNEIADARVIILTGAGRGFCAGQDLNDRAVTSGDHPVDLGMTVETAWNPLVRKITSLPQPVIARVNGVAAGAGANIALACDLVVAARSAKFIQSFSAIGLIPDSGGTWALPRLVGQARAMGLALTGEPLSAEKAEEWGLIWKCVDDEALDTGSGRDRAEAGLASAARARGDQGNDPRKLEPHAGPGAQSPAGRDATSWLFRRLSRGRRGVPGKKAA
jgi:2-(1,2-epoxy-1,2-dihydrophenyl)acetyl-CoA isomerase